MTAIGDLNYYQNWFETSEWGVVLYVVLSALSLSVSSWFAWKSWKDKNKTDSYVLGGYALLSFASLVASIVYAVNYYESKDAASKAVVAIPKHVSASPTGTNA